MLMYTPFALRRVCSDRRWCLVLVAVVLMLVAVLYSRVSMATVPPNLAEPGMMQAVGFNEHWARGDMIVLLRHVERCDRSSNPCLQGSDGITVNGKAAALELGKGFRQLGLSHTDIYSSPIKRTVQTALFAFGRAVTNQAWLSTTCQSSLLQDVLKLKDKQRNMLLVTHSKCIREFENALQWSNSLADYGTALFAVVIKGRPQIIGYLNVADWQTVLPH